MKRRDFLRNTAVSASALAILGRNSWGADVPQVSSTPSLLVETEMFQDKGGWKLDPQFMDQMGGVYLLAHGLGNPVENAKTAVQFPQEGTYHVWVRTKNWCPGEWEAPGRFRVLVDGVATESEFGAGTENKWHWQKGGTVKVKGGKSTIELQDLTGFDGRCDSLFFTQDAQYQPPNQLESLWLWKSKLAGRTHEPTETLTYDVIVIGGGIAGCGAAIAAESQGLKVALIQDRPVFGGNASSEIRVHTEGIHGKADGILTQIDTKHWPNGSDEAYGDDDKRQATLNKTNIAQFPSHRAWSLQKDGNRIASIEARETGTGVIRRFIAPTFIDCTGDGWIGFWAGADYRYGREAASEFGESWDKYGELWSPEKADNRVMGTSVMWNTAMGKERSVFPDVPWAKPVSKDLMETRGDWDWEYSANELDQIDDAEEIRDHMFRAIYGTFANAKKHPKNAALDLVWVAHIAGKRESRRLMGDYIYTMSDSAGSKEFEDAVVTEKRDVDVHFQNALKGSPYDFRSTALYRKPVNKIYYIPFRSLYSRNVDNLMMAGRCFSCSHIGLGGPRVQNTTGQMGVATGFAAALCKKYQTTPKRVGESHIAELRKLAGYDA